MDASSWDTLKSRLQAIAAGDISNTEDVRRTLVAARDSVDGLMRFRMDMSYLLEKAERAFVSGRPVSP